MGTESTTTNKTVQGNADKYDAFKVLIARYKKANQQGFFFEALWILYSMFEDRTSAFLYYIGFVTEDRKKAVGDKSIQQSIRGVLKLGEKANFDFGTLYGKTTTIKKVTTWAQNTPSNDEYQKELKILLNRKAINSPEFLTCLDGIDYWRDKRNGLTHALFSIKSYEMAKELKPLSEQGYQLARTLDNAVNALRKRDQQNSIREKFKLK
ncbi:MAG: hypothetical protein FWH57_12625 [Oscillospiraceae bacterium]|nr:hypothetical protein [Oscillospiraceae bacterium]